MSSLRDIAYVLENCDSTTLIVLQGPAGVGKSFLTQAIARYFGEVPEIHMEEESGYYPSPTFDGPCRIYQSLSATPVIDATYPWVRYICYVRVEKEVIGHFDSVEKLVERLEQENTETESGE